MENKKLSNIELIRQWILLIASLLWIPLGIAAFVVAPAELYIKLLVAAIFSLLTLLLAVAGRA